MYPNRQKMHDAGAARARQRLSGPTMPWKVLGAQVDAVGGSHGDRVGGVCYQVVRADELSICRRCDDQLLCKGCLGHAKHASECGRVRSIVRSMAQSLTPHIRESARRVAVVQLSSSGLTVPMSTTSIASPLVPSSLLEYLSRCSVVSPSGLQVYWRLLIPFLAVGQGWR